MRIENTYYVIMQVGNIERQGVELGNHETAFASNSDLTEFTNDIKSAIKFTTRSAALSCKQDYDTWKNNCYESDFKIIPVKVTYEW